MLVLIDNFLSKDEQQQINTYFIANKEGFWVDGVTSDKFCLLKILDEANKYFHIEKTIGAECWAHENTRPDWHIDKDETLMKYTGALATPLCSIVYYGLIDGLEGGEFMTETETIKPRENSLLMFSSGILHTVNPYKGNRLSLAINPWAYKVPLLKDY